MASTLLYQAVHCPACKKNERKERFLRLAAQNSPNLEIIGEYVRSDKKVLCRCRKCGHTLSVRARDITEGIDSCVNCGSKGTSYTERFILYFLRDVLGKEKVLSHDKTLIGSQIDIYIPSHNLAIEPGSWFWHWDKTSKDIEKIQKCAEQNVNLIVIYDACSCFYNEDYLEQVPKGALLYEQELSDPKNSDVLYDLCKLLYAKVSNKPLPASYNWEAIHNAASKRTAKRKDSKANHKKPLPGAVTKKHLPDGYKPKGRKKKPPKPKKEFDKSTSLAVKFPNIAKAYSPDNDKPADEIPPMSKTVRKWECPDCHTDFECSPITFTDTSGDQFSCPECGMGHFPSFAEALLWICCQDVFGQGEVVFKDNSLGLPAPLTTYMPSLKSGVLLYGKTLEKAGISVEDIILRAQDIGISITVIFHMTEPSETFKSSSYSYYVINRAICKTQCEEYADTISKIISTMCKHADEKGVEHGMPKSPKDILRKRKSASKKLYTNFLSGPTLADMPGISELWDYRRNGDYLPEDIPKKTSNTFWLRCPECDHEFPMPSGSKSVRCPKCAEEKERSKRREEHKTAADAAPVLLDYWDWERNEMSPYDISLYYGGDVELRCPICNERFTTHRMYRTIASESKCPNCLSKVTKGYGFAQEPEIRQFLSEWNIADKDEQDEFISDLADYGTEHEPHRYNRLEIYEKVRKMNDLIYPSEIADELCTHGADAVRLRIKENGIEAVAFPMQGRLYRRDEIIQLLERLGMLRDGIS